MMKLNQLINALSAIPKSAFRADTCVTLVDGETERRFYIDSITCKYVRGYCTLDIKFNYEDESPIG